MAPTDSQKPLASLRSKNTRNRGQTTVSNDTYLVAGEAHGSRLKSGITNDDGPDRPIRDAARSSMRPIAEGFDSEWNAGYGFSTVEGW